MTSSSQGLSFPEERAWVRGCLQLFNPNTYSLTPVNQTSLDRWYDLKLSSGIHIKSKLLEENIYALFHKIPCIYKLLGKEMCVALDVALAAGGCEAVVEVFYSVVAAHKKSGG